MNPELDGREGGFSALEVLIAFVILSLGMAMAAQTIAGARQSAAQATRETRTIEMVDRLLSEEVPKLTIGPNDARRTVRGPDWQIELRPLSEFDNTLAMILIRIGGEDSGKASDTYVTIRPVLERGDDLVRQ